MTLCEPNTCEPWIFEPTQENLLSPYAPYRLSPIQIIHIINVLQSMLDSTTLLNILVQTSTPMLLIQLFKLWKCLLCSSQPIVIIKSWQKITRICKGIFPMPLDLASVPYFTFLHNLGHFILSALCDTSTTELSRSSHRIRQLAPQFNWPFLKVSFPFIFNIESQRSRACHRELLQTIYQPKLLTRIYFLYKGLQLLNYNPNCLLKKVVISLAMANFNPWTIFKFTFHQSIHPFFVHD